MTAKIARETWIKFGYAAFLIAAVAYGLFRFNAQLQEASTDEAVRNQLRNLHAVARDYSARHGNQATVQVSELDQAALYNAGIRPPLNGVFPVTVILGAPLKVTGIDGRRTVVFDPAR